MSRLKTKTIKLGDSATESNNYQIKVPAIPDGTMIIETADGTPQISFDGIYVILNNISNYTDDTAAASGGVPVGGIYRNGSVLQIRVV